MRFRRVYFNIMNRDMQLIMHLYIRLTHLMVEDFPLIAILVMDLCLICLADINDDIYRYVIDENKIIYNKMPT